MQTFSDAEQVVTGIYAGLKSSALFSGSLTVMPDIQADLVYAVENFTNVYGSVWQWDILSTDSDVESVYAPSIRSSPAATSTSTVSTR